MFTVTEELKGLVIDYDSFENISVDEIRSLNNEIKCVIITSKFENKEYFDRELKGIKILYLNASEKNLSPNIYTHTKITPPVLHLQSYIQDFGCSTIWGLVKLQTF